MGDADAKDQQKAPFELTETDRWILSQTDEEFQTHSWAELTDIIANNDLAVLKRKPSDLRRYIAWSQDTIATYGSMMNFVVQERLRWTPPFESVSGIPFQHAADFKILRNDWPYGMDAGITHLVVWTKTPIDTDDDDEGDMTPASRALIDAFVQRTFVARLAAESPAAADQVLWFKNWAKLQSVRALAHVHVLVRDVRREIIDEWTGGEQTLDVELVER